jgi:hypothetical protein
MPREPPVPGLEHLFWLGPPSLTAVLHDPGESKSPPDARVVGLFLSADHWSSPNDLARA